MFEGIDRCTCLQKEEEDGYTKKRQYPATARTLLPDGCACNQLNQQRGGYSLRNVDQQHGERDEGFERITRFGMLDVVCSAGGRTEYHDILEHRLERKRQRHEDHTDDKDNGYKFGGGHSVLFSTLTKFQSNSVADGEGQVGTQRRQSVGGCVHISEQKLERLCKQFRSPNVATVRPNSYYKICHGIFISEPPKTGKLKHEFDVVCMSNKYSYEFLLFGSSLMQIVCDLRTTFGKTFSECLSITSHILNQHCRLVSETDASESWKAAACGMSVHTRQFSLLLEQECMATCKKHHSTFRREYSNKMRLSLGVCASISTWFGCVAMLGLEDVNTEYRLLCAVDSMIASIFENWAFDKMPMCVKREYESLLKARHALCHPLITEWISNQRCVRGNISATELLRIELIVFRGAVWSDSTHTIDDYIKYLERKRVDRTYFHLHELSGINMVPRGQFVDIHEPSLADTQSTCSINFCER